MDLRKFSVAAIVALLLFSPQPLRLRAEEGTFRVLVPQSTASLPLLLLADRDPVPGVDVRAEFFVNHAQALVALVRGDADALLTGTSQGWENYLGGGPLVMVDTGVWGVSYLMGLVTTEGIDSFAGLKGKRIALPFPGAPLDFQTRYLLSRAGVDPDRDLEILYAPFGQSVSLLLSGRIDAAPLPEPLATDLAVGRGLSRLLDYQEAWAEVTGDPRSPQVSLFVTRDTARQHPELLARLVEAWRDSSAVVVESPDSTASRYAGLLGMSPEIVARSVGYTLLYVPGFQENRRRVLSYYELLRSFLPGERPPLGAGFFFLP